MNQPPPHPPPSSPRGSSVRRWSKALVLLVSLLCLVWVFWPIAQHARQLRQGVDGAALAGGILTGAVVYGLLCVLLATAWWWLAGIYGQRPPLVRLFSLWARTQIAKYLPGNVFHYVGRQVLGREEGLSHAALVASGVLEMISLLLAAALLSAIGAAQTRTTLPIGHSLPVVLAVALGGLAVWPAIDRMLRRWPPSAARMAELPSLSIVQALWLVGPALALHLLFFVGTGLVLWSLLVEAWPGASVDVVDIVWLYAVAWAAGTVTPGAPGGVGVREAVLTLELTPLIGAPRAAALAVSLRLVTVGGDLLTALAGWLAGRAWE